MKREKAKTSPAKTDPSSAPAPSSSTDFWYSRPRPVQRNPLRFFARLIAFTVACPRCAEISTCGPGRPGSARAWAPRQSRWRCIHCGLTLMLGVSAWTVSTGVWRSRPPEDAIPSVHEGQRIRYSIRTGGKARDPLWQRALSAAAHAIGETDPVAALRKVRAGLRSRKKGATVEWEAWGAALLGELERVRGRAQAPKRGGTVLVNRLHAFGDAAPKPPTEDSGEDSGE